MFPHCESNNIGTVEPLYKGQVGGGSFVPYTVEPLYKGQVGWVLCPLHSGASLQGTSWMGPLSLTVEPLYKGQVEDGSFVPYSGASLQGTS